MGTAVIYRDREEGLRLRYEALEERVGGKLRVVGVDVDRVYRRRAARTAAGLVGIAGAVAMVAAVAKPYVFPTLETIGRRHDGSATSMLLASWAGALAAYLAVSVAAPARLRQVVKRVLRPSGDVERDLARLGSARPGDAARVIADRMERGSVALPLIALALLVPLTIHLVVYGLFLAKSHDIAGSFDEWIGLSLVIVGHAHLALALFGYLFARKLRRSSALQIQTAPRSDGWFALLWTIAVSCVPGIVLFLIPPILTAVTGILFVPTIFRMLRQRVLAERAALEVNEYHTGLAELEAA